MCVLILLFYQCGVSVVGKADVWQADKLLYLSPAVRNATTYNVSVQLDGTLSVPPVQTFTVLPDPTFYIFKDGTKAHEGGVLQIEVSAISLCKPSSLLSTLQ